MKSSKISFSFNSLINNPLVPETLQKNIVVIIINFEYYKTTIYSFNEFNFQDIKIIKLKEIKKPFHSHSGSSSTSGSDRFCFFLFLQKVTQLSFSTACRWLLFFDQYKLAVN